MGRPKTGRPRGRPPTEASVSRDLAVKRNLMLDQIREVAQHLPLPAVPATKEELPRWIEEVNEHTRKLTEMEYRLQVAGMAEKNPEEFLKLVSRNADIHMPKLGRVEQKVDHTLTQTFVRVSERDEPLGMKQLPDGTWEPILPVKGELFVSE